MNKKEIISSNHSNHKSSINSKLTASYNPGQCNVCSDETISAILDSWLETVKLRCKPTTYDKYLSVCKLHIVPYIGKFRTDFLKTTDIIVLISNNLNLSNSMKNYILGVLKMAFDYASMEGYTNNINFKAITIRVQQKNICVLDVSNQKILSDYLLTNDDKCKLGVYLCLCTGLRLGELCALKRRNIDFKESLLTIESTIQRINTDEEGSKTKMIITSPKTPSSARQIPLPSFLIRKVESIFKPLHPEAFLLTGEVYKFIQPRTLENRFKSYLIQCNIGHMNFHALRHTFATRCIENGMDIKTLSEIMGHKSINVTLQKYIHLSLNAKRSNMENVSQAFN